MLNSYYYEIKQECWFTERAFLFQQHTLSSEHRFLVQCKENDAEALGADVTDAEDKDWVTVSTGLLRSTHKIVWMYGKLYTEEDAITLAETLFSQEVVSFPSMEWKDIENLYHNYE